MSLRDGTGKDVELKLHPLPSQTELPCWLTIVNNQETYRKAGELGVGVLTNLMGQTLEELTANIAIYRATLAEFGHDPQTGHVTVLLHTYIREDAEQAIREARRPLCDYLLSSMTLFKRLAQSQSLAIDLDGLSVEDREYIVQKAYDKYVAHQRANRLARHLPPDRGKSDCGGRRRNCVLRRLRRSHRIGVTWSAAA